MMTRIFRLGLLSLMILYVKCDDLDYCYDKDGNPYKLFSTWTPPSNVWVHVETKESGCKPIYVWGLLKHGIKSFTTEQIKSSENLWKVKRDIEQNEKENRCALCGEDYQNIHSSSADFSLRRDHEVELAKTAISAHDLFASHLRQVMDSSPAFSFAKKDIEIQRSEAKEAKDTAIKFANSFLKDSNVDDIITENKGLLRTRSSCANWKANNKEADDFIPSLIVESMRLEVSYRLGFIDRLPVDTIKTMYESCVFWNILPTLNKPPFCAAFSPVHLKIMEYWKDLEHYYEFGYGNKLSEKMGCTLLRDMTDKLVTAASGTWEEKQGSITVSKWTGKRVNINIGDEENLMGMITRMGLYHDEEALKHDNYNLQKTNRKWRSSLLSPFDGSLHAILYNCNNNEKMVEFYLNHDIVKFDACKNRPDGKCPLATFLTEVKKNLVEESCGRDFCGSFPQKSAESGSNMVSYSFVVMIVCFLFNRLHNMF